MNSPASCSALDQPAGRVTIKPRRNANSPEVSYMPGGRSAQSPTCRSHLSGRRTTPLAGAGLKRVGAAGGVAIGGVAVADAGVIGRAVGGGALDVGSGGVDVDGATPEQADSANAAIRTVSFICCLRPVVPSLRLLDAGYHGAGTPQSPNSSSSPGVSVIWCRFVPSFRMM